jgi:hypothetical protein
LAECASDRVCERSEGVVEDEQIFLLVLLESKSEVAQDWLEERGKRLFGFLFECSESGTAGFLDALVSVKYPFE